MIGHLAGPGTPTCGLCVLIAEFSVRSHTERARSNTLQAVQRLLADRLELDPAKLDPAAPLEELVRLTEKPQIGPDAHAAIAPQTIDLYLIRRVAGVVT